MMRTERGANPPPATGRRHRKSSLRRAGTGAGPASQGQEVAPSGPGVPTGSGVVTSGGTRARDAAMVVDLTSSSSTSAAVASATRLSSAGVIGRPVKGIKSSMQTGVGAGASAVIAGAAGNVGNGNNVSTVAGGSSGSGRERVVGDRSLSVPAGYSMGTAKGLVRRGGTGGLIGGGAAGGGEGWRRYVYPSGTVYEGDMVDDKREGDGVYIDKNSNRYEGQWRNDRAEGYGIKVFAKGDRHEGYYSNDKRNGFGTYYWANGKERHDIKIAGVR